MRRLISSVLFVLAMATADARGDEAEEKAVKLIELSGSQVGRDDAKPGKPVTFVRLGPKAGRAEVKALGAFNHLSFLIAEQPFTDDDAASIAGSKSLKVLVIRNAKGLTNAGLKEIARVVGLTNFTVQEAVAVTETGFKELAPLGGLTQLVVEGGTLTDAHFRVVAGMKKLAILSLRADKSEATDKGLEELINLTDVGSLGFSCGPGVTDAGLKVLAKLPKLRSVGLWNAEQLTDEGLKEIGRLDRLGSILLLGANRVTDAGLKELSGLTHLVGVTLGGDKISGVGLKELAGATRLYTLHLHCRALSDEGLREIVRLKSITDLELRDAAGLTRDGLKSLTALPQLNYLNLRGTGVTDDWLKDVTACKSLQVIALSNTKVTDVGVKEFQKALPRCRVVR